MINHRPLQPVAVHLVSQVCPAPKLAHRESQRHDNDDDPGVLVMGGRHKRFSWRLAIRQGTQEETAQAGAQGGSVRSTAVDGTNVSPLPTIVKYAT